MKKILLICSCVLALAACSQSPEVAREKRPFTVLTDSIYTSMPGDLILSPKYLVWSDPFSDGAFIHVHDTVNGQEIGAMGSIGQGPEEFVSPGMSRFAVNNEIYASDANSNNRGYFSIDSLLCGGKAFRRIEGDSLQTYSRVTEHLYISDTKDGDEVYFSALIDGQNVTFGNYPIPDIKQHLFGSLAYDVRNSNFIYAALDIPYLSCYHYDETAGNFELLWERKTSVDNYRMENGYLQFDMDKAKGASELCLSRDYIITLERDRKYDQTKESSVGRDASLRPTTVFLYDYEGNLKRIVDIGAPILRICSDVTRNTVYALVVNPDYTLVKCEL